MPRPSVSIKRGIIRRLRKSKGLSPEDFARLSGVGIRTVHNAEAGERISIAVARAFAKVFQVKPEDLVQGGKVLEPRVNAPTGTRPPIDPSNPRHPFTRRLAAND